MFNTHTHTHTMYEPCLYILAALTMSALWICALMRGMFTTPGGAGSDWDCSTGSGLGSAPGNLHGIWGSIQRMNHCLVFLSASIRESYHILKVNVKHVQKIRTLHYSGHLVHTMVSWLKTYQLVLGLETHGWFLNTTGWTGIETGRLVGTGSGQGRVDSVHLERRCTDVSSWGSYTSSLEDATNTLSEEKKETRTLLN